VKHVAWGILLLVLVGQGIINYRLDNTNRAIMTAVYILQAHISIDELQAINQRYKDNQRKNARRDFDEQRANRAIAGIPGSFQTAK
jgi:hypothetical protein